jgi:DNA topoisomerase VI subunit B
MSNIALISCISKKVPYKSKAKETLNAKTKKEISEWAKFVLKALSNECDMNNDTFYILAGKIYYSQLVGILKNKRIIMENLPIGKQLQWLKKIG